MTHRRRAFRSSTSVESDWLDAALPGDKSFEIDADFLKLSVTPFDRQSTSITSDAIWELPSTWRGSNVTTPDGHLKFRMDWRTPAESSHHPDLKASLVSFVRKSFYLEINWPRQPLSISTLRKRLRFYKNIALFCESLGRNPNSLELADLHVFASQATKTDLLQMHGCNEMMIRWYSASRDNFIGYHPPNKDRIFNVDNHDIVRAEDEPSSPTLRAKNKHLPDWFVSKLIKSCFFIIDELRPVLKKYLMELKRLSGSSEPTPEMIKTTALKFEWPIQYPFKSSRSIRNFLNLSQGATISIVSLAIGSRWSEVGSAKRTALHIEPDGQSVVRLQTFKDVKSATGTSRELPVNSTVALAIQGHLEILKLTEQSDFPFLWRSNDVIINSGKPLKQVDKTMSAIYAAADAPLDDGSSFHHHRFRHTLARIVVLALLGGVLIVRRLLDHDDVGVTLGYLKENSDLLYELEIVSNQVNSALVSNVIKTQDDLCGGGVAGLQRDIAAALPEVITAKSYREQKDVQIEDIVEALSNLPDDEFQISNILPGLVVCRRPHGKAGSCCRPEDPQNIAKCDSLCVWHINTGDYRSQVIRDVLSSLDAIAGFQPNSLSYLYHEGLISSYLRRWPDILDEINSHPSFLKFQDFIDTSPNSKEN